jgi:hypothetical protein
MKRTKVNSSRLLGSGNASYGELWSRQTNIVTPQVIGEDFLETLNNEDVMLTKQQHTIKQVSVGSLHFAFVTHDGVAYTVGCVFTLIEYNVINLVVFVTK